MCVCAQVSNLQTLLPAARRRLEHLNAIKQEVNERRHHRQVQIQQLQASCRRYQDRLQKVQKHHLGKILEVLVLSQHRGPGSVCFRPCRT